MVWLRDSQIVEFPWFDMFLMDFSYVRDLPKVWNAFLKWSYLDEETAANAVSYGTFPIVNVKKSLHSPYDNGHWNISMPNEVWIRRDEVKIYEKTMDPIIEFNAAKYLESLILHELVHWGRYQMSAEDPYYEGQKDSGDMFKREAYKDPNQPHLG